MNKIQIHRQSVGRKLVCRAIKFPDYAQASAEFMKNPILQPIEFHELIITLPRVTFYECD